MFVRPFISLEFVKNKNYIFVVCLSIIIGMMLGWQWSQSVESNRQVEIQSKITELELLVAEITGSSTLDKASLNFTINQLQEQISLFATDTAVVERDELVNRISLLKGISTKYNDYLSKGTKVATYEASLLKIYNNFTNNDPKLTDEINSLNSQLDQVWRLKLEQDALAKQATAPLMISGSPNSGHSRITVQTSQGNFVTDVITAPLATTKIITVTGNDGNCENNCTAKSLSEYIRDNSGFAGMNGSYFCPPDYSSCEAKTYSYDFPVYSSIHNKWINADKLFWNDRGMASFVGNSPRFCESANSCDSGGVSAGIVNYPSLISNGNIVVNSGALPDNLTKNKGMRGAIGVSNEKIFLVIIRGATVIDSAHVMKNLGVNHALNLDGGGSSAMYYNGYKVGPGRLLPNAIVLQ